MGRDTPEVIWGLAKLTSVAAVLCALVACTPKTDITSTETREGGTYSAADRARMVSQTKTITGDYFLNRDTHDDWVIGYKGDENEDKTKEQDKEQQSEVQALRQEVEALKKEVHGQNATAAAGVAAGGAVAGTAAHTTTDAKERLRLLNDLREEGLITEEQYNRKLREIVGEL